MANDAPDRDREGRAGFIATSDAVHVHALAHARGPGPGLTHVLTLAPAPGLDPRDAVHVIVVGPEGVPVRLPGPPRARGTNVDMMIAAHVAGTAAAAVVARVEMTVEGMGRPDTRAEPVVSGL